MDNFACSGEYAINRAHCIQIYIKVVHDMVGRFSTPSAKLLPTPMIVIYNIGFDTHKLLK